MPPEKRPADALGSTQMVVKRQKSNLDLGGGRAVAVANGNIKTGALIQAVSTCSVDHRERRTCAERNVQRRPADGEMRLGATHKWTAGADNGTHWSEF